MQLAANSWDGNPLGPGPIALTAVPGAEDNGSCPCVLAWPFSTPTAVSVESERFAEFVEKHGSAIFVCADAAVLHWQIHACLANRKAEGGLRSLWQLSKQGRLVDVPRLDRQLRHACGEDSRSIHSVEQIAALGGRSRAEVGTETAADVYRKVGLRDQNWAVPDEILRLLTAFSHLWAHAKVLEAEARPIARPEYVIEGDAEDQIEEQEITAEEAPITGQGPAGVNLQERWSSDSGGDTDQEGAEAFSHSSYSHANSLGVIGHGVEVYAAIALQSARHAGLIIDRQRLGEFLLRVQEEYRNASKALFQKPETRDCFRWSGEEVSCNKRGFPEIKTKELRKWLRKAADRLCDAQVQPAMIPREADGQPTSNPEHWGIWAGCDRHLWAWRQIFRMAELGRIAGAHECVRPRYETLPLLRSLEPNLPVYRSLGVPIFRPRDGHVFVAGQLLDLKTRCLVAVCLQRGYFHRTSSRLYSYFLRQSDPLAEVACDLNATCALRRSGSDEEYFRAETEFLTWQEARSDERFGYWLQLTDALLECVPLGLPSVFLTRLLQLEYGFDDLTEPDVIRLQAALTQGVAGELELYLEDLIFDLVTKRFGLNFNQGLREFIDPDHPEHTGPSLRTALRQSKRHPVNRFLKETRTAYSSDVAEPNQLIRRALFTYRDASLAGRVTARAASLAVRRQEVLLSEDEVMMSVAHALFAADHLLLGVAGSEFLLEVSVDRATENELRRVGDLVEEASGRLLGNVPVAFRLCCATYW